MSDGSGWRLLPRVLPRAPAFGSRGGRRIHRVLHPLCGARLDVLAALAARGGIAPSRVHVLAIAFASGLLRLPFTAAETVTARLARRDYPAPVFIVGHWRSGTTHLANLLTRSGAFGVLSPVSVGLPAEAVGLGRVMAPLIGQFLPRTRLIDRMALGPDLPQEDELAIANLSTLSCQHGIYFPHHLRESFDRGVFGDGVGAREWARWSARLERYVAKMTWQAGGRPLLIRNPANSTRTGMLRAIWPDARFIHIHRDPAAVYPSSVRMFSTLVRELSLGRDGADVRDLVRHVYPRLMRQLIEAGDRLPASVLTTVRFDDLRRTPMAELARVHDALDLPQAEGGRLAAARYLRDLRHEPARHELGTEDRSWIDRECGSIARALGYRHEPSGSRDRSGERNTLGA